MLLVNKLWSKLIIIKKKLVLTAAGCGVQLKFHLWRLLFKTLFLVVLVLSHLNLSWFKLFLFLSGCDWKWFIPRNNLISLSLKAIDIFFFPLPSWNLILIFLPHNLMILCLWNTCGCQTVLHHIPWPKYIYSISIKMLHALLKILLWVLHWEGFATYYFDIFVWKLSKLLI